MGYYGAMDKPKLKRRKKVKPALRRYSEGEYKWVVYFQDEHGNRIRRKFRQKKDATQFLTDKEVSVENLGNSIASTLDEEVKRHAFTAVGLLRPYGKTILDAAKHYRAYLEANAKSVKLKLAAEEFVAAMTNAGKSARYVGDLKIRVTAFVKTREERMCAEIFTKEIAQWLQGLGVTNTTRNNFRRVLCTFFGWCAKMGYTPDNPALAVGRMKGEATSIDIYTPAQMRLILHAATNWVPEDVNREGRGRPATFVHETKDIIANMVICGFAGLRQAEFERLSWEQIKQDKALIDMSASITKSAARRLVTIRPVLQEWLAELSPFGKGLICQKNFSNRLRAFRSHLHEKYGLMWKHNALRHSFASYLMEEVKNPGEVSLQLGHNDAGIVFAHYRELVTADDANDFWTLTPDRSSKFVWTAITEIKGKLFAS